jgi:vitamin B12 transporter
MRFFAFLLLAAASTAVRGAPIQGSVSDPSNSPIPNARVECGDLSVDTDTEGRFSLPSACAATVSASGFTSKRVQVAQGSRVVLDVEGINERVTISATRMELTPEEAGVSGNVITSKDLEYRQAPLLVDLLREVPGLHVAKFGRHGASSQVFSRGAQRTGTLVMVDGVPVNDPGGDLNFAHLATGAVDRVEIVRGAESALFGAEASSAVIQIFTRRGTSESKVPHGFVSYERGSFQTDRWIANLAGGSGDRLDYALTTEQFHTVSEFPNDAYRNTTGSANVGWRLSNATQLRGVLRSFDSVVGVPNRTAYNIIDNDARRENRDYVGSLRIDDVRGRLVQRGTVGYHRLKDQFFDEFVDGPYTRVALLRDAPGRVYFERLVAPGTVAPAGYRVRSITTRLTPAPSVSITARKNVDYQGTVADAHGATLFGYEFENQGGNISGNDVDRSNHGVFLHKQHTFAGRVFLSAGARLEQNTVFGTKFTPRAAISIQLLPATFFRVSAGRGITEPSLLQSFAQTPTFWGNPNLRLEKTNSYEAGLVREWAGKRIRTEVSAFHNSFRDLIVFLTNTWENVDRSYARGFEFSGQARVQRFVTVGGNYTLLWTRITHSSTPNSLSTGIGQELIRRPRNSGATFITIAPARWYLQAGASFLGERQDSDPFGVTRAPSYAVAYAAGAYNVNRYVQPFIRVDNLANSRYEEVLGYSSLSRTIRGGLKLQW